MTMLSHNVLTLIEVAMDIKAKEAMHGRADDETYQERDALMMAIDKEAYGLQDEIDALHKEIARLENYSDSIRARIDSIGDRRYC